jgi:hypothetical protein
VSQSGLGHFFDSAVLKIGFEKIQSKIEQVVNTGGSLQEEVVKTI